MFADSRQPAEEKKLRIFTHDFGHDVDDEVAFTMLCRSIAEGKVKPEEAVIIVTGDYPKQGMYAAYDIARTILGEEAAFKMTIIPAAPYTNKSPGTGDDILCANGVKWSEFQKNALPKLQAALKAKQEFYSKNHAAIESEEPPNDALAAEYLKTSSEAANNISIALCSKNGSYLDAINIENVRKLILQVALSQDQLVGFNNTKDQYSASSNCGFIAKLNRANPAAEIIAIDTTAASFACLDGQNAEAHQKRYKAAKMMEWPLNVEALKNSNLRTHLTAIGKKDSDITPEGATEILKKSVDIDPRAPAFILFLPQFNQARFFANSCTFSGEDAELVADCKAVYEKKFLAIIEETNPRNHKEFSVETWLSCFKTTGTAQERFHLKDSADFSESQKETLGLIASQQKAMVAAEDALITKLRAEYPEVKIQFPSRLYDTLVVAMTIEPEQYALVNLDKQKAKVMVEGEIIPMSVVVGSSSVSQLPNIIRLKSSEEQQLSSLITNHYNYGLAPNIHSLLVNDLPKEKILTELKRQVTDNALYWTPTVRSSSIVNLLTWADNVLAKEQNSLSAGFYGSHVSPK